MASSVAWWLVRSALPTEWTPVGVQDRELDHLAVADAVRLGHGPIDAGFARTIMLIDLWRAEHSFSGRLAGFTSPRATIELPVTERQACNVETKDPLINNQIAHDFGI